MKRLNVDDASKSVNILVISLNVLHNYFDIAQMCTWNLWKLPFKHFEATNVISSVQDM